MEFSISIEADVDCRRDNAFAVFTSHHVEPPAHKHTGELAFFCYWTLRNLSNLEVNPHFQSCLCASVSDLGNACADLPRTWPAPFPQVGLSRLVHPNDAWSRTKRKFYAVARLCFSPAGLNVDFRFFNEGFGLLSQDLIVPCAFNSNVALLKYFALCHEKDRGCRLCLVEIARACVDACRSGVLGLHNQMPLGMRILMEVLPIGELVEIAESEGKRKRTSEFIQR